MNQKIQTLYRKYNQEREHDKKLFLFTDLKKECDKFFKIEMKKLGT